MVKEGEGKGRGGGTCSKVLGGIDAPATERRRYGVTACSCCYSHSVSASEVISVCGNDASDSNTITCYQSCLLH